MNDNASPPPLGKVIKMQYVWIARLDMSAEARLSKDYGLFEPGQVYEIDNLQDVEILEKIMRPPAGCCGTNQGPSPYFVKVEN